MGKKPGRVDPICTKMFSQFQFLYFKIIGLKITSSCFFQSSNKGVMTSFDTNCNITFWLFFHFFFWNMGDIFKFWFLLYVILKIPFVIWNKLEVSWIRSLGWPVYFTGFQKKKPTFSYLDNRVISLYNTFYYGFNNILKIFSVKNNYLQVPPPSNIYLFFPKNSSRLVRTNVSLRSEDCV